MGEIGNLLTAQSERLVYYSPYNFLRAAGTKIQLDYLKHKLESWLVGKPDFKIFKTISGKETYYFFYQQLPWDSTHFNFPTFKLFTVLYPEKNYEGLVKAAEAFRNEIKANGKCYYFADIPSEDVLLIQALNEIGFRLTETRLTYYKDGVEQFDYPRSKVREASINDIPTLRKVASEARNNFDRYHADVFFSQEQADNYLATYVEASVNGLSDTVLVPSEYGVPAEAFLAISLLKEDSDFLSIPMARVVLTAVGPACKGWHVKLVAETVQYAKEKNRSYVLMTTQSTNRAVFRTSEKLGFKLGGSTHILATSFN